ncbi:MAG: type II toxin-antitoxin system HigA family antitoxin [Planctomycetia bacterium]
MMRAAGHDSKAKLPGTFKELVGMMPPQAIMDEVHYENTVEMIDRLMAGGRLTKGQELYLETLVQLVQAYEASHHAIRPIKGIAALRHILADHGIHASGLARLLGVHASMGSKILKGERALTVSHIRVLAAKFKVRPDTFLDG